MERVMYATTELPVVVLQASSSLASVSQLPQMFPGVTPETFAEAEKLMQVTMTPAERQQAAQSWRTSLAPYLERRTGPRKVSLKETDAPATLWHPLLPGIPEVELRDRFMRSRAENTPLPSADEDIAFAPVTKLSRW